jgi:hypothetical protein
VREEGREREGGTGERREGERNLERDKKGREGQNGQRKEKRERERGRRGEMENRITPSAR